MNSPPTTGGRLVYAVGDVHGRTDALRPLLSLIREDARRTAPPRAPPEALREAPLLVFLGDYVDRGPDSRGVIDMILALEAAGDFEVACLKGNHEDALLRVLTDDAFVRSWIENWGEATLRSYGVATPAYGRAMEEAPRVQADLAAALPPDHHRFLARCRLSLTVGDYLFVHAGVRPGIPIDAQDPRDLMWIRHVFLDSDEDHGKVVVHGHTPSENPERRHNRIGVDTGVYMTGVLTAVRLLGTDQRIIQARA